MQNDNIYTLKDLPPGKKGTVESLAIRGAARRRMLDLGLTSGTAVEALHKSPSGDPVAYWIRGTVIALRGEDAGRVLIRPA